MKDLSDIDQLRLNDARSWVDSGGECCAAVMHMMPIGLVEMDESGSVLSMNATARRLLQNTLTPAADIGTVNLFDSLGDAGGRLRSLLAAASGPSAEALCHGYRIPGAARSGGTMSEPPETLGITLTWPLHGVLLAVIDDLTDLVSAEAQAASANAAKSAFLAGMSHELRQPLNAILGFSDVMRSGVFGPLSDRYQGYVGHIVQAGGHLLDLVNDILDLAKVEAGHMQLDEAAIQVHELFETAASLVQPQAGKRGVKLNVADVPPNLGLWGDARRLKQILLNLLSNAVKFTPPGGDVSLQATTTADGWLEVSVSDTGCGIAPEDIERVLTPFVQTASGRSQTDSTGLGLPLAKTLSERHEGRLILSSIVDTGTTVTVRFPAHRRLSLPVHTR